MINKTKITKNVNIIYYKIAFLFLTIDNMLAPKIWDKFFENKENEKFYNIYVNAKYSHKISKDQWYLYNNILPTHLLVNNTKRKKLSLVRASNILFKTAYNDDILNQKFILLSESHVPLYNFNKIYTKLIDNNNIDNISYIKKAYKTRDLQTIQNRYFKIKNQFFRNHENESMTLNDFETEFVDFTHFIPSYQWIVLDRYLITTYLLKYKNGWNKYFEDVLCTPDENYYSTLFSKYMDNENEWNKYIKDIYLTFVVMMENGHARKLYYLSMNDINKLRNNSYLFLRKINKYTRVDITYLLK